MRSVDISEDGDDDINYQLELAVELLAEFVNRCEERYPSWTDLQQRADKIINNHNREIT